MRAKKAIVASAACLAIPLGLASAPPSVAANSGTTCNDEVESTHPLPIYEILIPARGYGNGGNDYYTTFCTLQYGDTGLGVLTLQKTFKRCYNSKVALDGQFGSYTKGVMEAVQRYHGIQADGKYGTTTRGVMRFRPYYSDFGECSKILDAP